MHNVDYSPSEIHKAAAAAHETAARLHREAAERHEMSNLNAARQSAEKALYCCDIAAKQSVTACYLSTRSEYAALKSM